MENKYETQEAYYPHNCGGEMIDTIDYQKRQPSQNSDSSKLVVATNLTGLEESFKG